MGAVDGRVVLVRLPLDDSDTRDGIGIVPPSEGASTPSSEADHLAVKSVKQTCLSSSAEALVRWGPVKAKKRYQRCRHDDDRQACPHRRTHTYIRTRKWTHHGFAALES